MASAGGDVPRREGSQIGNFHLVREVGAGGMGIVYQAVDLELDRTVALKLIRPELSADPSFRQRFERERRAQAKLDHENIVHVYGSGEAEQHLYLITQFVDGASLGDRLLHGPTSTAGTLAVLGQVASALDYAHGRGTIHRDVKPQNILIADGGRTFLADFGLAWAPEQSPMTSLHGFVGTVSYASPEQLRGLELSPASDVYSLTCVLYECLVGQPAFAGSDFAVAVAHASDDRPCPSAVDPALPAAVDAVVARGMARDPDARFQSAGALIEAAAGALAGQPGDPGRLAGTPPPRAITRRPAPLARRGAPTVGADGLPAFPEPREPGAGGQPPAAGASPPRRLLSASSIPIVVLAAIVLAVLGFLVGQGQSGASEDRLSGVARSHGVSLGYPETWRPVDSGPGVPGLSFRHPLRLVAWTQPASGLAAGMVSARGRFLLPRPFVEGLRRAPRQRETIRVTDGVAYRYRNLRIRRGFDRPLDLYVLPTDRGVATIACYGDDMTACGRIAESLALSAATAYRLGPSAAYAATLNRTLAELREQRRDERRRLAGAERRQAQAAAGFALARAFQKAARRLDSVDLTPQSAAGGAALTASLNRVASTYRQLALAARRDDEAAYLAAASEIKRREPLVERSLLLLRPLGYRVA